MRAIRYMGPHRLEKIEDYPECTPPAEQQALIEVGAVGVCGSDLHMFDTGGIGSIRGREPYVPGHEFMGTVVAVGREARDGNGAPLVAGTRVAVDPHIACRHCEVCEAGHPNLCPHHTFFGLPGLDGGLREKMLVPARNCFPIPKDISNGAGAILETLGVALHSVDLAKLRVGSSCAVLGCGPVGLLIVQLAHLAGAHHLVAVDPHPWRAENARMLGATHIIRSKAEDSINDIMRATDGRGCDIVFEAAWAGAAVQASVDIARPGAKVVLVGIPEDDDCSLTHSPARRKGLTLIFSRRMKHVYPRTIALTSGPRPRVELDMLITHEFPLEKAGEAFETNLRYDDGIIKAIIHPNGLP